MRVSFKTGFGSLLFGLLFGTNSLVHAFPDTHIQSNFDFSDLDVAPFAALHSATPTFTRFEMSARAADLLSTTLLKLYPQYRARDTLVCALGWADGNSGLSRATTPSSAHQLLFVSSVPEEPEIQIIITDTLEPNAYVLSPESETNTPATIAISQRLLEVTRTEAELAFIVAHEMSHIELEHFEPQIPFGLFTGAQLQTIREVHKGWELSADERAIRVLRQAGFHPRDTLSILATLNAHEGDAASGASSHPSLAERFTTLLVWSQGHV